jgi:FKBP-type peptidyl-prolyl cis-trans isomerase
MASNTKPHQRAFALTIALIFLVTTIATSALVVMSIINDNKQQDTTSDLPTETNPANANQLAGTKLANFTPVASVDKLQIIDTKVGTGPEVKAGATVTAHYTGAVAATGVIFQSSHDTGQPIPFSLNEVIKGWTDGVPGMKVGGTRRLVIPADQAYGANPPEGSNIPANAALVFDIEVTAVE